MVPIGHYLVLAGTLFAIGAAGVVSRRNAIVALMSIEIMLNAAILAFLAFARLHGDLRGHAMAFFVMAVAAAEAAVGLAIVVAVFRRRATVNLDELRELKG
ncbi:MAG: NADH-quinone oxidoreductase subunit NuoK [Deltaproteobacteria bacterium]|nr:NADH-quinone oxidoreductase subunit NuoK [Deltaproteobacteria bacterium]